MYKEDTQKEWEEITVDFERSIRRKLGEKGVDVDYIIKHVKSKLPFVSCSNEEKFYDKFLEDYYQGIANETENGLWNPLLVLKFLWEFEPITQRTKYYQQYYLDAEESRQRALDGVLELIPSEIASMLDRHLFNRWKRAQVPEKLEIKLGQLNGHEFKLVRPAKRDLWFVQMDGQLLEFGIRLGHLGKSGIQHKVGVADFGGIKRITILVYTDTDRFDYNTVRLEVYFKDEEFRYTPWFLAMNEFNMEPEDKRVIGPYMIVCHALLGDDTNRFEKEVVDGSTLIIDKEQFYPTVAINSEEVYIVENWKIQDYAITKDWERHWLK